MKRVFCSAVFAIAGAACCAAQGKSPETNPDGKGNRPVFAQPPGEAKPGKPQPGNGINYHGGPLITSGPKMYYIWYGNWSGNTATTILTDLANSMGGSPYFGINTTYSNGAAVHVTNAVALAGSTFVNGYPYGSSLSDSQIQQVVIDALNGTNVSTKLTFDSSGVYFVLTSADVTASSGFCTKYCGWHTYTALTNGGVLKYAFIGDPARCPSACAATQIQSNPPNGNLGADAMASIIAHELEEATTDPQLNAWYDTRGMENADKCAWTFGAVLTNPATGASYNVTLGSREFLIQQNWVNQSGGYCAMSVTH
ncbi:MAG: EXORDIUM family protein [Acidobacteriia bacterium]|nr:EXORDIUM family protein [Terriglobia bacterium]